MFLSGSWGFVLSNLNPQAKSQSILFQFFALLIYLICI